MAGKKRDDHRPRRARGSEAEDTDPGAVPGSERPETAEPTDSPKSGNAKSGDTQSGDTQPGNTKSGNTQSASTQRSGQSTSDRVAEARRAERVAELRRMRDSKGNAHHPAKADRPDVGQRRKEPKAVSTAAKQRSGRRSGVIIAAIAAVVVAAVVVGIVYFSPDTTTPVGSQTPTPSAPTTNNLINGSAMLSPEGANAIIDKKWQIDSDQPGDSKDSPVPACLAIDVDDDLKPADSMARTLTTSKKGPTALHRAEAYPTAELATEAFALMAKALGECKLEGSFISDARVISGIGDQATGVVLDDPSKDSRRAVVLNRTGRLINVLDVAATGQTPDIDKAADALAGVTDTQCTAAIGICASSPKIETGPPPVGGDQPGFLATADLPQPETGKGTWEGLAPGSTEDVITSGCENVDFTYLTATNRVARSYVLSDDPKGMPDAFGLDQIILTMDSKKAAADTAELIGDNIRDCEDRLPTAKVGGVHDVEAVGADGTKITGMIASVRQRVTADERTTYRVGVTSADSKVIYTFLSKDGDWDLSREQWQIVTGRAAQRATQVR